MKKKRVLRNVLLNATNNKYHTQATKKIEVNELMKRMNVYVGEGEEHKDE